MHKSCQEPWGTWRLEPGGTPGDAGPEANSFLSPRHREPDSTYFDLPPPNRGNNEAVGSEETSMDVFHLPGMTSSVMVSEAGLAEDWTLVINVGWLFLGTGGTRKQGFGWPTFG